MHFVKKLQGNLRNIFNNILLDAVFDKIRIFWEGHKILSGTFFQILWPSQNIRLKRLDTWSSISAELNTMRIFRFKK